MNHFDRNLLNLTVTTLLSVLAAGTAAAASATAPLSFKDCDSNGDGAVSLDEFRAVGGHEQAFREGDANGDQRLSAEEYGKARAYNDRIKAGKADDAAVSARIEALLQSHPPTRSADVTVRAHKGMVLLSGWVTDPRQIAEAEKVVRRVEGVKLVSNDLMVRR